MPVIAQIGRDVTQDFEEIREKRIPKDDAFLNVSLAQKKGIDWKESQQFYEKWNGDDYDAEILSVGYKAPLWALDYFLHLNFDKNVRILDVCCGTGLVARYFKQHGYCNIEGLDSSQAMLDKARNKQLYNEYYCCPIGDGQRAPIDDEQFDVITVAGGFVEAHLKVDAFDEMLRMLKVGGYIINTMKDENRSIVYNGAFDKHCRRLVDEGKWELVYEHVNPRYYLKIPGLVQVYRKTTEAAKAEAFNKIAEVQTPGLSHEQSQQVYARWNGDQYDADFKNRGVYRGAEWVVDYLLDLGLDSSAKILDVCCGTGLVAKALRDRNPGFGRIDGVDASGAMLDAAKKRDIYGKLFNCRVGGGAPPIPVENGSYDAVMVSAAFAEGHLEVDAFDEMLRVLKKGGFVVNVMREANRRKGAMYEGKFDRHCQELVDRGEWVKIYEHINQNYVEGALGFVQVYQKPDPKRPWWPTQKQQDNWESILRVQKKGMSYDQAQEKYTEWNGDDYDTHMLAVGYKAPEWVVDYFLRLNLDPSVRILDIAAGTGLVARSLKEKSRGKYTNIEALDASIEMLDGARKLNIYKDFHHCMIGGGHRPDLPEAHYDVITIAGGFAEAHMEVDAFDEMLRLLKVGGYIINVMREENRHKCDLYAGKFDEHCRELVEQKKWEVVYEHVNPRYYMDYHGLVQVYRKTAEISVSQAYENIMKPQSPGITWKQSQEIYLGWNGANYEANKMAANYRGAEWAAEYLTGLGLNKHSRILDVCAGTGLVAKQLIQRGYTNIDALDSSKEMLKGSVGRGYKNFHVLTIGCDDIKTYIGESVYDAVVIAGGFAEGHLLPSAFRELLRLTRPGGYIVNAMRERDRRDVAVFRGAFDRTCRRLAQEGCWEILYEHINANYIANENGLVQVFRIRRRAHLESGCWTGNAEEEELDNEEEEGESR